LKKAGGEKVKSRSENWRRKNRKWKCKWL